MYSRTKKEDVLLLAEVGIMNFRVMVFVVGVFTLVGSTVSAVHAGDASPVVLANTCFSCHGTNGKSLGAMPSINGKPAQYTELMLNAFREDRRQGTIMNRISKGFTPQEIKSLSHYLSTLK
jgi:cytochrome subunit of sulfide dehydrogenase